MNRRSLLLPVARHEAAHCVVARKLGLVVEFVACQPEQLVEVSSLEAMLYSRVEEGEEIPACLTRLADNSWEIDPVSVLAAMAAPSYLRSGSRLIDAYARLERRKAVRVAAREGLVTRDFAGEAKKLAREHKSEIEALGRTLLRRGRIWF